MRSSAWAFATVCTQMVPLSMPSGFSWVSTTEGQSRTGGPAAVKATWGPKSDTTGTGWGISSNVATY